MLRVSSFLKILRLTMEPCADAGKDLPAEAVPVICDMLRFLATESENMENRLAGKVSDQGEMEGSNIVSLAAFAARKSVMSSGGDMA